jgi:hypothetical protein
MSATRIVRGVVVLLAGTATQSSIALSQSASGDKPVPGVEGVLAAFARAPIVALADVHRDDAMAGFRLQLIRHSGFTAVTRDVAVEWGNALYQPLLDRFVAGQDVPLDTVRQIWRNAIGNLNGIFDSPVYEQFIVAVRDVNRGLAPARRIRVLACDPPVDWTHVSTRDDLARFATRDETCALILEREILARGRSALLILGGGHVLRTGGALDGGGPNLTALLDQRHPGSVFVVTTRGSRDTDVLTRGWSEPAFLTLRGTALGRDMTEYGPFDGLADGYLLLHRGQDVEPDPAIYDGSTYRRELDRRWCLTRGRPFQIPTAVGQASQSADSCQKFTSLSGAHQ